MTNGYSEKIEVETAVAAIGRLSSPGQTLHSVGLKAIEAFRKLDYPNQVLVADALAGHMEVALGLWAEEMKTLVRR